MEKTIESLSFDDAREMVAAVAAMCELYPDEIIYSRGSDFYVSGTATLLEETLSDGSKVYNIALTAKID